MSRIDLTRMEMTLTDFRRTALAGDGDIRLASGGTSLEVVKDGVFAKVRRLFGGGASTAANRDVRFAFVQAAQKSGVVLSTSVLRDLGLAEDSKISASARPLTCRTVRRLLNEVNGLNRS